MPSISYKGRSKTWEHYVKREEFKVKAKLSLEFWATRQSNYTCGKWKKN